MLIVVTLDGIVMLVMFLQLMKAHFSRVFVPSLSVTLVTFDESTIDGIDESVPGNFTLVLPEGIAISEVCALL